MTVKTESPGLDNWSVDEDDYGDPMIFHRHASEAVPAYVVGRWADRVIAQCSECGAHFDFYRDPRAMREFAR